MEGKNFPSYLKAALRQFFFWGGGGGGGLKAQVCYIFTVALEKSPLESESIWQPINVFLFIIFTLF